MFRDVTELLCMLKFNHEFCDMAENNIVKPMLKNFVERVLYAEATCARLSFCKYPILVKDSDLEYMSRVLKNKPPVERPRVSKNPKKMTFIVFADVHLDYMYKEGSIADCPYPVCCREHNGLGYEKSDLPEGSERAGKWGSVAKCDLPPVFFVGKRL